MAGVMDKLRSLQPNISGVTEPTKQIAKKFVTEEALKYFPTDIPKNIRKL